MSQYDYPVRNTLRARLLAAAGLGTALAVAALLFFTGLDGPAPAAEAQDRRKLDPPGAPTNLRFTDLSDDLKDALAWDAPADGGGAITHYELQRREIFLPNWGTPVSTGAPITAVRAVKEGPGWSYLYRVRAVNRVGPGDWSNEIKVSGKPGWHPGAAGTPTATPHASLPQITLNWRYKLWYSSGTAITGWTWRWKLAGADHWTVGGRTQPDDTSAVLSGLEYGTAYDFDVIAHNAHRSSYASTAVRVTTFETEIEITGIEGDDDYINVAEEADGIEVTGTATEGAAIALTQGGNTIAETVADARGDWMAVIPHHRFPQGEITFNATATKHGDTAQASYTLTVDLHVPHLTILGLPWTAVNTANPAAVISVDEPGVRVSYEGPCGDATPATIAERQTPTTLTYGPLAEGLYSGCSITVTDAAGNRNARSAFTLWDFEVDLTPPTLLSMEKADVFRSQLRLRFSEEVQTSDVWALREAFTVRNEDGDQLAVYEIVGRGRELLLDIYIPSGTSQLTLEYIGVREDGPVPAALQDIAGNLLANIEDHTVTIE